MRPGGRRGRCSEQHRSGLTRGGRRRPPGTRRGRRELGCRDHRFGNEFGLALSGGGFKLGDATMKPGRSSALSMNNPAIGSADWRLWLPVAAVVLVLVAFGVMPLQSLTLTPTITNSGGAFQVQSVQLTRGKHQAFYYPGWIWYRYSEARRRLGLRGQVDSYRIDCPTSVESTAVLIKWRSSDGRISTADVLHYDWSHPSHHVTVSTSDGVHGHLISLVADPKRKSGWLLWLTEANLNELKGAELKLTTDEGSSIIRFN